MNKITRKRPNTMYDRTQLYKYTGRYVEYSLKEFSKYFKKYKRKLSRFRNGKSGRYTTISKKAQFIEVNNYEWKKADSN